MVLFPIIVSLIFFATLFSAVHKMRISEPLKVLGTLVVAGATVIFFIKMLKMFL